MEVKKIIKKISLLIMIPKNHQKTILLVTYIKKVKMQEMPEIARLPNEC
jgi:hypothetical protein